METEARAPSLPPISEKLVARLWDEQRPFALPLVTTDGQEIQVVYRGRRRWDRGPDFVGALIAHADATLRNGDVEIHVRSSDWQAHGHHRDPHYNRVILQVVMCADLAEPTLRQDGVRVPVLALFPHLSAPLESLSPAPPGDAMLPSPCWRGTPESDQELADRLDQCGMERFAAKVARFESDLAAHSGRPSAFGFREQSAHPDQLLYRGIADALGYSRNREPFRRLSELLPLEVLLSYRRHQHPAPSTRHSAPSLVEALLLGAAGLLPSQRSMVPPEDDRYTGAAEDRWAVEGAAWVGNSTGAIDWDFFRVRPANFPTRRVAALAGVVARWPEEGLADLLASLVRSTERRKLARTLESLLIQGKPEGYWSHHCDFGLRLRRPSHPVGRQRAAEIVVNVFLPLLAARASHLDDRELVSRVLEAYRLYPKRGDNEIARYVAAQITGLPRPRVARSACRQQGLLHLFWSFCETKRCGECPCRYAQI